MNIRTHSMRRAVTHALRCCALLPCIVAGAAYAQSASSSALLEQALAYEQSSNYANAAQTYYEYLSLPEPQSAQRRYARLKLPVLQEAAKYGAGPEMQLYLNAMNMRAAGDSQSADQSLLELVESYAGSALSDDAWYLRAYIALMDNYDYQTTVELLEHLRFNYPDSRYIDTALFAEAIAYEQLGDGDTALARMMELRDRHTGLSVAGIDWAKDEYTSRLWFERSNDRIDYLEQRAETATQLLSLTPYNRDDYLWQAELLVNQQHVTLLLNESETVTNAVFKSNNQNRIDSPVNAYAGIVAGQPESWARITINNQNVRGMISTDTEKHELIPVSTGGSLSDFHTLLLGDIDGNATEAPDHVLIPPQSNDRLDSFMRSIRSSTEFTEGSVNQAALIGVVVDSKFNDYFAGHGADEALSIINTTDGLFREQLGIALLVDTLVIIENRQNDPMDLGSVTMETMMRNFRDYRIESSDLGSDIGLATLFSGNKNSDAALGLAWIGSACRTDGFDVSVVTPYRYPALLSTHEIGHTMGAPHDTDTSCAAQNEHIMWPFLSGASGRTFSSCSKDSVNAVMAANYCHLDAFDLSTSLQSISTDSLAINVSNEETQRATPDGLVTIEGADVGTAITTADCDKISSDKLECHLGTLTPFDSNQLDFEFESPLASNTQITVTVEGVSFIDVNTQNNSFQTDITGKIGSGSQSAPDSTITLSDNGSSSETRDLSARADGGGGGPFNPLNNLALTLLIAIRRKKTPEQTQEDPT